MNKETARIYKNANVDFETLLSLNFKSEVRQFISDYDNRLVCCTDNRIIMRKFCLFGIALGLVTEYLVADSFFSPVALSYREITEVKLCELDDDNDISSLRTYTSVKFTAIGFNETVIIKAVNSPRG